MTRDGDIMVLTIKFIKQLSEANKFTGPCLVPYYRQILPTFNQCYKKQPNTLDKFVYSQRKDLNIGQVIEDCLQVLENTGGENAIVHIKSMIPTYETDKIIIRKR